MKVLVIGAAGGTGKLVVDQGVARGWPMTALSRRPVGLPGASEVSGDATDPAVIAQALDGGQDAVVLAIGGTSGSHTNRTDVTAVVLAALAGTATRVVVHSSLGVGDSMAYLPGPSRLFAKTLLGRALADHAAQERLVTGSGHPWTIVRPGGLTDQPSEGRMVALEGRGELNPSVPRADVAAFIFDCLDDPATVGRTFALGTRRG